MIAQLLAVAVNLTVSTAAARTAPAAKKNNVFYQTRFLIDGKLIANPQLSTPDGKEISNIVPEPFKIRLKPMILAGDEILTDCSVSYEVPGAKFVNRFQVKSKSGDVTGINDAGSEHTYQLDLRATIRPVNP